MLRKALLALSIVLVQETVWAAACGPVYGADGIAVDGDGKVWMVHYEDVRLGRLDPVSGEFAEFLPTTQGNAHAAARNTWTKEGGFDYAFDFGMMGLANDDADGLVWSRRFNGNKVLRFSKAEQQFSEFELPGQLSARFAIPMDARGNIWLVASKGLSKSIEGNAVKISPDGTMESFPLPWEKFTGGDLALDKNGNPWVTATPAGGSAELYAWTGKGFERRELPEVGSYISSMYIDAGGDLWFAAPEKNAIGRLRNGELQLFSIPTPGASPATLISDRAGNLWFTEWFGNKLGRIAPDGKITEFPLPPEEETPLAIMPDRNGRIWFSVAFNYSLFRLDPATGRITEFPVPVPANWSKDAARGASFCTIKRKDVPKAEPVKAEQSAATEQMVHGTVLRHPKGYPENGDAMLFEQKCQTVCHTWYRVDKAAARRSDWGPTVERMIDFNGAAISAEQRQRIVDYMNGNYAGLK